MLQRLIHARISTCCIPLAAISQAKSCDVGNHIGDTNQGAAGHQMTRQRIVFFGGTRHARSAAVEPDRWSIRQHFRRDFNKRALVRGRAEPGQLRRVERELIATSTTISSNAARLLATMSDTDGQL